MSAHGDIFACCAQFVTTEKAVMVGAAATKPLTCTEHRTIKLNSLLTVWAQKFNKNLHVERKISQIQE